MISTLLAPLLATALSASAPDPGLPAAIYWILPGAPKASCQKLNVLPQSPTDTLMPQAQRPRKGAPTPALAARNLTSSIAKADAPPMSASVQLLLYADHWMIDRGSRSIWTPPHDSWVATDTCQQTFTPGVRAHQRISTDRGDWYLSAEACAKALSEGARPLDLGGCALTFTRPAEAGAAAASVKRAIHQLGLLAARGGSLYGQSVLDERGDCARWTFEPDRAHPGQGNWRTLSPGANGGSTREEYGYQLGERTLTLLGPSTEELDADGGEVSAMGLGDASEASVDHWTAQSVALQDVPWFFTREACRAAAARKP